MSRSDLSDRALLDALRRDDSPTDADAARVRQKVAARVAALAGAAGVGASIHPATGGSGAAASGASVAAGKATGALAGLALGWKVTAFAVAVLAGGAMAGRWTLKAHDGAHDATASSPATTAFSQGVLAPARSASEPAATRVEGAAPDRSEGLAGRGPGASVPLAANPSSALDEEVAILRRAQQALSRGDGRSALRALDEHRAKYPHGLLADERSAVHAVALCEGGDLERGRAEAERFLAGSPSSPLRARVQSSCLSPRK